jgi:1-deoxy-D-xylulose-5-phosphate synthase
MLDLAVGLEAPVAIRYPKGVSGLSRAVTNPIAPGRAEIVKDGSDIAIISIGSMLETAVETAELLSKKKIGAAVVNARFIKPIDEAMISDICRSTGKVVTLEDGVLEGGFGSAVLETIERLSIKGVKVRRFGLPDRFIEHGRRSELFSKYNLTPQSICDVIIREVI